MAEKKTNEETLPQDMVGEAKEHITKMEAVKRTLEKEGKDSKLKDLKAAIMRDFGYDMTTDHIKTCRNKILKPQPKKPGSRTSQAGSSAVREAVELPEESAPPALISPAEESNGKGAAIQIDDIVRLKGLVERVGPEHLKKLIDVMER